MTREQLHNICLAWCVGRIKDNDLLIAVEAYSSASNDAKPIVRGSASDFEKDLYKLINSYVNAGLKKPDLVGKMVYVTESCRVS